MLFELREYRTRPGKREEWVRVMEDEIIPFQMSKGVVVAGTGLGHVSKNLIEGVIKTAEQIPVAMTSQCLAGGINMNVYSNGRELVKGNVIDTGDMLPETALVKMMWLLKHEKDNVREMMATDMIGEMGGRRFLE